MIKKIYLQTLKFIFGFGLASVFCKKINLLHIYTKYNVSLIWVFLSLPITKNQFAMVSFHQLLNELLIKSYI